MKQDSVVRIAAVGDLHCSFISPEFLRTVCDEMKERADVVVLCGDLTHHGNPEEANTLLECLQIFSCPVLAVLGNHDHEHGKADIIRQILEEAGIIILDGTSHTINGVDFIGVKGFGGGFGDYALQPWGEAIMKEFVQETQQEARKFEAALRQSTNTHRVAILHYSPIRETVEGEAKEIIPFLGSSMFEEALMHYPVNVVFHGHAHHGKMEGRTSNHIPVWNVAMPLLHRTNPAMLPFFVHTLKLATPIDHHET
ncbi:MAG: metallophosphoesterase [Nitrospirales bacterium]|nr:MAG: metallophosphoesterase [Nitrospirales bacterium]